MPDKRTIKVGDAEYPVAPDVLHGVVVDGVTMKVCAHCHRAKPLAEFGAHRYTRDRLQQECRTCQGERLMANRAKGRQQAEPTIDVGPIASPGVLATVATRADEEIPPAPGTTSLHAWVEAARAARTASLFVNDEFAVMCLPTGSRRPRFALLRHADGPVAAPTEGGAQGGSYISNDWLAFLTELVGDRRGRAYWETGGVEA